MRFASRFAYGIIVSAIGLAWFFSGSIVAISLFTSIFVFGEPKHSGFWLFVPLLLFPTIVGACIWAIVVRLRLRWLASAAAIAGAMLAFLAYDDSSPPPPADLGPRVGMDDPGYRAIMWLSQKSPYGRLKEPGAPPQDSENLRLPEEVKDWAANVAQKRAAVLLAWEQNTVGREWVETLATRPPNGVWPMSVADPIVDFRAIRSTMDLTLGRAYALALDGNRDGALRSVLTMIRAAHNLERTGPGMLNAAISPVVLKACYRAVGAILDLGPVSADTRSLLRQTLTAAPPIRQIFRNAFLGEWDFIRGVFDQLRRGQYHGADFSPSAADRWIEIGMTYCGPLVINPNRTERQIDSVLSNIENRAEARDLVSLEHWLPNWGTSSQLKNPVGRLLAAMIIPAFQKVVTTIWAAEDARLAILKRSESGVVIGAESPPRPASPGIQGTFTVDYPLADITTSPQLNPVVPTQAFDQPREVGRTRADAPFLPTPHLPPILLGSSFQRGRRFAPSPRPLPQQNPT